MARTREALDELLVQGSAGEDERRRWGEDWKSAEL
jgi:hypothetical protein